MEPEPARVGPRDRVALTARTLFAQHGVDATSMQMVADELGVSKSAVFYHFPTKRELVEACAGLELAGLEAAVDAAEAATTRSEARQLLLQFAADRAVQRRREPTNLLNDPAMVRFLDEQGRFRALIVRFQRAFFDLDIPTGRVDAAILNVVMSHTVKDPLVDDIDDDELRSELLRVAQRLLP
jgi:AcrR family transcriptional regulator